MLDSYAAEVPSIDAVLAYFGLGTAKSVTQTQLGMANRSFRVITTTGAQYVVKILVHQSERLLINELAIQQQLHAHGIVAPRYIQSPTGEYVYRHASVTDFVAVASATIKGVHPNLVSRQLAHNMGNMLANYHAAVRSLPVAHTGWLNRTTASLPAAESEHSAGKEAALALIAQGEPMFASHMPSGIIHGDFHTGNLLVRSQSDARIVAMLDFEEAEENLLLVDVAFGLFGSHSLAYTSAAHPCRRARIPRWLRGCQSSWSRRKALTWLPPFAMLLGPALSGCTNMAIMPMRFTTSRLRMHCAGSI